MPSLPLSRYAFRQVTNTFWNSVSPSAKWVNATCLAVRVRETSYVQAPAQGLARSRPLISGGSCCD